MKKKEEDLTRIEDLSEFLHDEGDDLDFDQFEDNSGSDFDLANDATDPNIQLPDEFLVQISSEEEDGEVKASSSFEDESDFGDADDFSPPEFNGGNEFESSEDPIEFSNNESVFEENTDFSGDFSSSEFEDPIIEELSESDIEEELVPQDNQQELAEREDDSLENPEENMQDHVLETVLKQDSNQALQSTYKAPENFKELRDFANTINYSNAQHEGNPPYSLVLSNIQFKEDIEDILIILGEFGIISDSTSRMAYTESLNRGSALIPRLSEYAAIILSHKLRRFNLHLKMGLTEQIAPPKSYSSDDKGLVSKYSVYNSQSVDYHFEKEIVKPQDVQLTTLATIPGFEIIQQLGIINLPTQITREELSNTKDFNINIFENTLNEMRVQCAQKNANAIIGIQYQLLPDANSKDDHISVILTGNIVWLRKL